MFSWKDPSTRRDREEEKEDREEERQEERGDQDSLRNQENRSGA